jgi:O-antigen/teichoic acid export membrane protein
MRSGDEPVRAAAPGSRAATLLRLQRSSVSQLFLANVASAGLSFLTAVALAAGLGASSYGVYATVLSVFLFCAVPADLGWFATGARRLVALPAELVRPVLAALALVWLLACLVVAGAALALGLSGLFPAAVSQALIASSAVAGGGLTAYLTEQVLKGLGRPGLLALCNVGTRVGVLGLVLLLTLADVGPTRMVIAVFGLQLVVVPVLLLALGAVVRGGLEELRGPLALAHRGFGRGLALGRSANLLAFKSDALVLAATAAPRQVGYYLLAQTTMAPVVLLAQARATRDFRRALGTWLAPGVLRRTFVEAVALVVAVLPVGFVISRIEGYGPVLALLPLCGLAVVLQACYQPYNGWLLANASGPAFRTMLLSAAAANLAANLALIPWLGAAGAAAASCVGNACYLALARRRYSRDSSALPVRDDRTDEGGT